LNELGTFEREFWAIFAVSQPKQQINITRQTKTATFQDSENQTISKIALLGEPVKR
jgi:hypothetical protein